MLAVSDLFLGNLSVHHDYAAVQHKVPFAGLLDAVFCNILHQREDLGAVAFVGRGGDHGRGIGDAHMNNALFHKIRIADRGII